MIDAYCHLDMSVDQPVADLVQRMDEAGIDRALVVETWSRDNHACIQQLIDSPSARFCVAPCFCAEQAQLSAELLSSEVVRALRVKTADLHRLGEIAAILESSGKWLLPHAESGIGRLTEELARATALHPGLSVYVPHLGWPRRDRQDDNDWHESISALRKLSNLILGISAAAHFSREAFPHYDIAPFAAHLLTTFGEEALVAASDYPLFEKEKYAQYMQLASDWIASCNRCGHCSEVRLFGERPVDKEG